VTSQTLIKAENEIDQGTHWRACYKQCI